MTGAPPFGRRRPVWLVLALATSERIGARPWLAIALEDYARLLLTGGGDADRKRANEFLERAGGIRREVGMAALQPV